MQLASTGCAPDLLGELRTIPDLVQGAGEHTVVYRAPVEKKT